MSCFHSFLSLLGIYSCSSWDPNNYEVSFKASFFMPRERAHTLNRGIELLRNPFLCDFSCLWHFLQEIMRFTSATALPAMWHCRRRTARPMAWPSPWALGRPRSSERRGNWCPAGKAPHGRRDWEKMENPTVSIVLGCYN